MKLALPLLCVAVASLSFAHDAAAQAPARRSINQLLRIRLLTEKPINVNGANYTLSAGAVPGKGMDDIIRGAASAKSASYIVQTRGWYSLDAMEQQQTVEELRDIILKGTTSIGTSFAMAHLMNVATTNASIITPKQAGLINKIAPLVTGGGSIAALINGMKNDTSQSAFNNSVLVALFGNLLSTTGSSRTLGSINGALQKVALAAFVLTQIQSLQGPIDSINQQAADIIAPLLPGPVTDPTVINTAAAKFKDLLKAVDSFYTVDVAKASASAKDPKVLAQFDAKGQDALKEVAKALDEAAAWWQKQRAQNPEWDSSLTFVAESTSDAF